MPSREAVTIRAPSGHSLEGRWMAPLHAPGHALALVAPPHPLYGGSIGNPVVRALEHAFVDAGYSTLAFNFRGIGESTGEPSGEPDDALADYLAAAGTPMGKRLEVVSGYSFGAVAALRAAIALGVPDVYMVAPPVFLLEGAPLAEFHGSLHVLVGDADEYAEPEALEAELARSPAARHMHWLAGADHFFLGSNVVALGERLRALVPEAPAR
jgi:uncharacterized protein